MNSIKLLFFLFIISSISYSQELSIKRENKTVKLSQLKSLKVVQNKLSYGKDSITVITEVDSLYKRGDTLIVRPWAMDETHYLDPNADITVSKLYKANATSLVKIPISEIEKITGKKRSLSRLLAGISTVAFVTIAASIPLRLSNPDNAKLGSHIFIVAAPTLILSWTLQATLAKKKYYFDKNRTDQKVWTFN